MFLTPIANLGLDQTNPALTKGNEIYAAAIKLLQEVSDTLDLVATGKLAHGPYPGFYDNFYGASNATGAGRWATAAKLMLLTHAFEVWAVQRVAICTDARNTRSRTAIQRIGATFEGVLRSHRPSYVAGEDGVLRDTAVYSIVRADWPAVKAGLENRLP